MTPSAATPVPTHYKLDIDIFDEGGRVRAETITIHSTDRSWHFVHGWIAEHRPELQGRRMSATHTIVPPSLQQDLL